MPTQEERRRLTRQRLLEAAAAVFARRGFAAASVEEIAKEAGYSTGAIYWHFSGKEDLFLAMAAEFAVDRVRELTGVIGDEEVDGAERGLRAGDQWMERLAADPVRFRVAIEFRNYAQDQPDVREALATRVAAVRDATARQIASDAAAGRIALPISAEDLAAVIRALGLGLAIEKLTDPDAIRDELFGDFLYVLFRLLERADPERVTPPRARSGRARRDPEP
jgi:AcrR family transcriptional regulator